MERILLVGTEAVESAGHRMEAAAEVMRNAASTYDHATMMHKQYLEDWLQRFEAAVERMQSPPL